MITQLIMTDGRFDCLARSIESYNYLDDRGAPVVDVIIHDDSGDPRNHRRIRRAYPDYELVTTRGRSGFGGAIRNAWAYLRERGTQPYLFITEDDFVIERPVNLSAMIDVLEYVPNLVQLVLKRQPWNPQEVEAGGIIEQHPDDYIQRSAFHGGVVWTEHRRFFSTNPYLARRSLIDRFDWPDAPHSEGVFTHRLLEDEDLVFAFWGAKDAPPIVEHIGIQRVGTGY